MGLWVAAAAVVLGVAVGAVLAGQALTAGARATATEAEHIAEPHGGPELISPGASSQGHPLAPAVESVRPAHEDEDARPSRATVDANPSNEAGDVVAEDVPVAVATAPEVPTESATQSSTKSSAATPRSRASKTAELERLDAEAQRRWRAGDLEGAEALFLEIVDKGGHSQHAELAFGDLFTLAHQTGNARKEQQRWRRYLARFPRGRFADDVRAWQCRRTASDEAAACWRRYLDDWPKGTYRAEANRSAASGGSTP